MSWVLGTGLSSQSTVVHMWSRAICISYLLKMQIPELRDLNLGSEIHILTTKKVKVHYSLNSSGLQSFF